MQRVHKSDAIGQKQLDEAVVHGVHAVAVSNLNQSRYLRKPPVPYTRLDSRVDSHYFTGQNQALLAAWQEVLAYHSQQRPRKLGTDELLALLWKGIKDAPNSRWRIVRVHGSNHEVTGFRRCQRSLDRVGVPHLAHKNDVRILSQSVFER